MAIPDLDSYKYALATQREIVPVTLSTLATVAGRPYDLWRGSTPLGAVPTASAIPTNDTLGALGQRNPASGQLSIVGARFNSFSPGLYLIADRLLHSGGLSGTVTTAQTTNLAATPLTRSTSGVGVMLGLTIYTQIGTTATTVRATYTNQAGTDSRVTPLVAIGGTGFREANRMLLLPLQEGDTGVRSVQSVTVTATTGTAGVFGVTLFKPLYAIMSDEVSGVVSAAGFITGKTGGGIPAIENNACLFPICISTSTNSQGAGALLMEIN
jgi:hypothetical protein